MLCSFCQHFDFEETSAKPGSAHQPNWEALCASARAGCSICELVKSRCRSAHLDDPGKHRWEDLKQEQIRCRMYGEGTMVWKLDWFIVAHTPIFTYSDDLLASVIEARPIHESILEPACRQMMRTWLRLCENGHASCSPPTEQPLPTRVLDVGSETHDPHLVISNGSVGRWLAMSHVWGKSIPITTVESNLDSRCSKIPLEEFGPQLVDVVLITRALGFQYLWIDSLCIIQSCQKDWATESSNMGYIYRNATLTIAAEASPDGAIGMFESASSSRAAQSIALSSSCSSKTKNIEGTIYFRATDHVPIHQASSRGPLSTRAWTLQDEILSPRILRFGEKEISWKCCSGVYRECLAEQLQTWPTLPNDFVISLPERVETFRKIQSSHESKTDDSKLKQYLLSFWYGEVLKNYVGRRLSYKRETLAAISGIAKEIQKLVPGMEWEAGLWLSDLHAGLTWSTPPGPITKHTEYVAPSWSWASTDFSDSNHEEHTIYGSDLTNACRRTLIPLADVGESGISHHKSDIGTVNVERLVLELTGPCCAVCSCRIPPAFFDINSRRDTESDKPFQLEKIASTGNLDPSIGSIDLDSITQNTCNTDVDENHKPHLYLQIGRWESNRDHPIPVVVALILEEVEKEKERLIYRRVGRALIPTGLVHDERWPVDTVTII